MTGARKVESLEEDLSPSQLAAKRLVEQLKNQPPFPPQEKSDKELRHEYLANKYGLDEEMGQDF